MGLIFPGTRKGGDGLLIHEGEEKMDNLQTSSVGELFVWAQNAA